MRTLFDPEFVFEEDNWIKPSVFHKVRNSPRMILPNSIMSLLQVLLAHELGFNSGILKRTTFKVSGLDGDSNFVV